jgi:hypothetical protein
MGRWSQPIPEHRQQQRLIGAGPWPHGEQQARQQSREFGPADAGPHGARPLGRLPELVAALS